jgi:hypothetical protein
MHAHDGTNIASQVATAGRDGEILDRVQAVGVDHEVAVVLVHRRRLAPIPVVEELGQCFPLDVVDRVHVKPGAVAGENDRMGLRDQMFPRCVLDELFCLGLAGTVGLAGAISLR